MFLFARNRRILSKFSCFAMEGSHRRLKRMLRNSGGLSLLRGHLGVQVVVDNHTIYDNLSGEGWDVTKRSIRGQRRMAMQQLVQPPARGPLVNSTIYKSSHSVSDAAASSGPRTCGHGTMRCGASTYLSWCTPHGGGARVRENECENRGIFA